jgi:hypothetical protein
MKKTGKEIAKDEMNSIRDELKQMKEYMSRLIGINRQLIEQAKTGKNSKSINNKFDFEKSSRKPEEENKIPLKADNKVADSNSEKQITSIKSILLHIVLGVSAFGIFAYFYSDSISLAVLKGKSAFVIISLAIIGIVFFIPKGCFFKVKNHCLKVKSSCAKLKDRFGNILNFIAGEEDE